MNLSTWKKLFSIALLSLFFITFGAFAGDNWFYADKSAEIQHEIQPGSLHRTGKLNVQYLELPDNHLEFVASMSYSITPRPLVPLPAKYRTGRLDQLLPIEFATEYGYKLLEKMGSMENDKARLSFIAREQALGLEECYKVLVTPASGKWQAYVWYHPSVASVGWVKTQLTIFNIPMVGDYTIVSYLSE